MLARYAIGIFLGSRSGTCAISSPVTFGGSAWVHAWAASSKGTVSSVLAWFRADSGTNLSTGKLSTMWLGSLVVRVLAWYAKGQVD